MLYRHNAAIRTDWNLVIWDNSLYKGISILRNLFSKNRAILVQKLWGEKKLSKSVFGYLKTKKNSKKKVPLAIKVIR